MHAWTLNIQPLPINYIMLWTLCIRKTVATINFKISTSHFLYTKLRVFGIAQIHVSREDLYKYFDILSIFEQCCM